MHLKREGKRKDRNNHTVYYVLNTYAECDIDTSDPEDQEDDCWDFWERNVEFYYLVVAHCKANPDVDIDVYEKDREADNDSDGE